MRQKKKSFVCNDCEAEFQLYFKGKKTPQICPFCGESVNLVDERPFLKDFDEYDEFDDAEYFSEDDEYDNEDDDDDN